MNISANLYSRLPKRLHWHLNAHVRHTLHGRTINIPVYHGEGCDVRQVGGWRVPMLRLLSSLAPGCFIDVGANMGQTLIDHILSDIPGEYFGFEPNPMCAAYLRRLAAANCQTVPVIVPTGLAHEARVCYLYRRDNVGDEHDAAATLIADLRPGLQPASVAVSVHSFDDVRSALDIGPIGIIKIDVEGAESDVIAGMEATLHHDRPYIVCEVLDTYVRGSRSENDARHAKLWMLLADAGYHVARIRKAPDEQQIFGLEVISAGFPSQTLTRKTAHECDYLFYHASKADELGDAVENFRSGDGATRPVVMS